MKRKIVYIIIVTAAVALFYLLPDTASGYESKGKRDPFVPLVGQEKAIRPAGLEGVVSIEDVLLEGIAIGPSGKNIRKIEEETGVSGIAIEDDGSIFITGTGDSAAMAGLTWGW